MEAHRVYAVLLLDANLPPPLGGRHGRIACQRELAVVHVAADPKRHARRKNSFNNFTQREYDFAEYERLILRATDPEGGQSENSVQ